MNLHLRNGGTTEDARLGRLVEAAPATWTSAHCLPYGYDTESEFSITQSSLTTLDNLISYVCTIADRYMLAEHLSRRMNNPLESEEGVPVADMIHWCHPSAEMVAMALEGTRL